MPETVAVVTESDAGVDIVMYPAWSHRFGSVADAMVCACRHAVKMRGDLAEACGYLLDVGGDLKFVEVQNVSPHYGTFAYSTEDAVAVYEAIDDGTLHGTWHSHPLGQRFPSAGDWLGQPRDYPMYIVSLESPGEAMILRFTDEDRPDAFAS